MRGNLNFLQGKAKEQVKPDQGRKKQRKFQMVHQHHMTEKSLIKLIKEQIGIAASTENNLMLFKMNIGFNQFFVFITEGKRAIQGKAKEDIYIDN